MELNQMMRAPVAPVAENRGNGGDGENGAVVGLDDRVRKHGERFAPDYRKMGLAEPPHLDAFYAGLKQLPLRRAKPGAGEQAVKQVAVENRKIVNDYMKGFSAGGDKPAYPKLTDRGMALVRSRELLEGDIACGPEQKTTLDDALKSAFGAVSGMQSMSRYSFFQNMMLGAEEYEFEQDW